jgi:2-keto-3-deoxy-L-fuconate dehydrogenase
MTGRLGSKRAFITGAGQGIGRAIALAFAGEGASVFASSRTASKMADLPGLSAAITPIGLDVTDGHAVARAITEHGPFDILVNCAAWVHNGTLLDCSPEEWAASLDQNVTSMYHTIRAALPAMLERRSGTIINVASVASSITGVPNRAAYGAAKAAVIGLTKAVAADFVGQGVRCNAICPGTVETPSLNQRLADTGDYEAARQAFTARQPMGRLGKPEELAQLALYLASDESSFTTGQIHIIDGGWIN